MAETVHPLANLLCDVQALQRRFYVQRAAEVRFHEWDIPNGRLLEEMVVGPLLRVDNTFHDRALAVEIEMTNEMLY